MSEIFVSMFDNNQDSVSDSCYGSCNCNQCYGCNCNQCYCVSCYSNCYEDCGSNSYC